MMPSISPPPDDDVLAFVMAGGAGERLRPLTESVPKPLLPFGGVFRILDFTLSNCRNSGIPFVGVLSQYEAAQVGDHLARVWSARDGSEFLHLPSCRPAGYRGTADAVRQNLDLALRRGVRDVLILSADHVYRADYRELLGVHRRAGADLTVSAVRVQRQEARRFGVLDVDDAGAIVRFIEKPADSRSVPGNSESVLASMGVYAFRIEALVEALTAEAPERMDFGKEVLPQMVGRRCLVAWEFRGAAGVSYWRDVGTLEGYQEAHMELLDGRAGVRFFSPRWPIEAADALTAGDRRRLDSRATSPLASIVPESAHVEGGVTESVLSPGARVEPGADVRRSVLMHGVRVGRGAQVRRALVARGVAIPAGERVGFDLTADCARFHVTDSGLVVIADSNAFARRRCYVGMSPAGQARRPALYAELHVLNRTAPAREIEAVQRAGSPWSCDGLETRS